MAGVWPLAILVGALGLAPGEAPLRWGCDEEGGAPYCFKRPSGDGFERVGFEVDIVLELRKRLGRAIEFTQYPFDNLVPGLKKRDFDLAMNGLEVTPDRRREVAFTRPYYLYRQQLVRRKGEGRFRDYPDLLKALPRARVGTMDGTAAERLLAADGVEVAGYPAPTESYRDLALGRLDAVLLDLPMAISYARNDPALEFAGDPFAPGRYAIAVHPDDHPLLERLNLAIDGMIADGALKAILVRWGLWDDFQETRLASATSGGDWELEGDSDALDWTLSRYIPLLLEGALVTVQLTACSFALAMSLGLLVAMARLYAPPPIAALAVAYVEFFRGIPVLLLLFFLYFGLPAVAEGAGWGGAAGWITPFVAATLGLGLNYAAYEAEIYRASLQAVPRGQWEAAACLGMPRRLAFTHVVLPQALRTALPPMTGDLVALFKDTSIASAIALVELNKQYQILAKSSLKFVEIGLVTAALYLALSLPLGYLSRRLERAWSRQQ